MRGQVPHKNITADDVLVSSEEVAAELEGLQRIIDELYLKIETLLKVCGTEGLLYSYIPMCVFGSCTAIRSQAFSTQLTMGKT